MKVRGWVAIVGTRWPAEATKSAVTQVTRWIVERGFGVVSGGAPGVDQIALDVAGPYGWVILPWKGFGRRSWPGRVTVYDAKVHKDWAHSVDLYHPAPHRLRHADRCLHARSFGIVAACCALIAFPRPRGGGTWQAIRIAKDLGKPMLILPDPVKDEDKERVQMFIAEKLVNIASG